MVIEYFEKAREFYKSKGIGQKIGFGEKVAVIVVDFQKGFTKIKSPLATDYSEQLRASRRLLDRAREKSAPIYYTITSYRSDRKDAAAWGKKMGDIFNFLVEGSEWVELDERLGRRDSEPIIYKKYPSAFFSTPLQSMLVTDRIDTIVVTGCVTSGCVRATVVEGVSLGYRVIVPQECVGDRHEVPHEANLFDIDTKYGDVVSLEEVLVHLKK